VLDSHGHLLWLLLLLLLELELCSEILWIRWRRFDPGKTKWPLIIVTAVAIAILFSAATTLFF
jgi:low affinity Fe/Cu permease